MNRFDWQERPQPNHDVVEDLSRELEIPHAGARLLAARSFTDAADIRRFLNPSIKDVHDPFEFVNMDRAVAMVKKAADMGGKLLIHGDYDVDGISGTALLYQYLMGLFADVYRFVPDRRKDGYGLSKRSVDWAIEAGVSLFIAVDCGTSDVELVERLEAAGVDVIICDHHEFPADGRYGGVMLNPIREGETYPFPSLCGTGVALKLVQALDQRGIRGRFRPDALLDLAALATVGDMSPLIGENRYFVRAGLDLMNSAPRPGVTAMKGFTRIGSRPIRSSHIAFAFAPRLNAPGRVSRPKPSLEILCEEQKDRAMQLAGQLEHENDRRKQLTKEVQEQAETMIKKMGKLDGVGALVLAAKGWDEGVMGIAAARVVETTGRPAVLLTINDDTAKGSGRSVAGVHLKNHLDHFADCFERYGGHAQAVGLTMPANRVDEFARGLSERVFAEVGEPKGLTLSIDTSIELEDCSMELLSFISQCEPFGSGNKEPVWKINDVQILRDTCIVGDGHMKFFFQDTRGNPGQAIAFGWNRSETPDDLIGRVVDLAVTIHSNEYQGRTYPDLHLVDIRFHQ